MEKTLHNIASLITDDMIEMMPEDFRNDLEAANVCFDENRYNSAAKLMVNATEILLRHFCSCLNSSTMPDFSDGWQPLLTDLKSYIPKISAELLARLELINNIHFEKIENTYQELALNEVEYLIVSCIDVCERIVVHPKYVLEIPNQH